VLAEKINQAIKRDRLLVPVLTIERRLWRLLDVIAAALKECAFLKLGKRLRRARIAKDAVAALDKAGEKRNPLRHQ
jgi:hypothetical protein